MLLKYFHTIRYLRPVQLVNRVWRRVKRINVAELPELAVRNRQRDLVAFNPADQCLFADGTAQFLNMRHSITAWNDPSLEKLWLYNLHYFDDVQCKDFASRFDLHRDLLDRWISENAPMEGNGWEPYPSSLRIVNLVKWFLSGVPQSPHWQASLALQAKVLSQSLEYHLLGNHLFANAKALIFAGLYFEGEQADKWLGIGLKIVDRELNEQVLADGGNFELSPMYHAIFLHDVLDLINVAQAFGVASWSEEWKGRISGWQLVAQNMLAWLETMTHPDGDVSFFNDATTGIAPTFAALTGYSESLGLTRAMVRSSPEASAESATHLKSSGYIRLDLADAVALLDVAAIGPDYLPGHAHADTLSFELSVNTHRLFVNSGISCYGTSKERSRQRGTAAHNTVVIDGHDSSQVWGGFRAAQRAYPVSLTQNSNDDSGMVCCSHTGYRWLPSKPKHTRVWEYERRSLTVRDSVVGGFTSATARFHIHPDWMVNFEGNKLTCTHANNQTVSILVSKGVGSIETSTYHPAFGVSIANKVLVVSFEESDIVTQISW